MGVIKLTNIPWEWKGASDVRRPWPPSSSRPAHFDRIQLAVLVLGIVDQRDAQGEWKLLRDEILA